MQIETVPIAELRPPPRNVRTHPEKQVSELARAIKMFGQTRPVIIDEDNTVLAGNGLVLALKELGHSEAAAYRVTGLSDTAKKKLMLSDNRIHTLGLDDNVSILEMLQSIDDLEIPGYDADILKSLRPVTVGNYGKFPEETIASARQRDIPPPQSGAPAGEEQPASPAAEDDELICPHCGHRFPAP